MCERDDRTTVHQTDGCMSGGRTSGLKVFAVTQSRSLCVSSPSYPAFPSSRQESGEITLKLCPFFFLSAALFATGCCPSVCMCRSVCSVCMWRTRNPCLMRRQKRGNRSKIADWYDEYRGRKDLLFRLSPCFMLSLMAAGHFRSRTSVPALLLSISPTFAASVTRILVLEADVSGMCLLFLISLHLALHWILPLR